MAALSAALFLVRWKGALHAIDYEERFLEGLVPQVSTLAELCSEILVADAGVTQRIVSFLPRQLHPFLMRAAITKGLDRAIEVLLPVWPASLLCLRDLWPHVYDNLAIVYDSSLHNARMRRGIHVTNSLIKAFLNFVRSKDKTSPLRTLDLREFPTVDLVVYSLAREIVHLNEEAQKNLETNIMLPGKHHKSFRDDDQYDIYIDCAVRDDETFQELCNALKLADSSTAPIALHVSKIDASCVGEAQICTLLDNLSTKELTGLCIQYNSLTNDGLLRLVPHLKNHMALVALDISCNNLNFANSPDMCSRFAETLGELTHLRRLDLSNNRLTRCVPRVLGKLSETKLDYLKLAACVLFESDIRFLSKTPTISSLLELDVSENVAISQQPFLFSTLLSSLSPSLQILELEDCKFNSHQMPNVVQALLCLRRLRYLNFARQALASSVLCAQLSLLGLLPKLECVRLSYAEDCYLDIFDSLSYDQRKTNLRDQMEKATAERRKTLTPAVLPVHFFWVEFVSIF